MSNLNITNAIETNGVDILGFNLQNPIQINQFVFGWEVMCNGDGVSAVTINLFDMSSINLDTFDAPSINGGGVLWQYWENRDIEIEFLLRKDTEAEFKTKLDEIKAKFSKTNAPFDWLYNWVVRRVRASLVSPIARVERISGSAMRFRMTLRSLDPDWQEITPTYEVYDSVSTSIQTNIDNDASQPAPVSFYIAYGSGSNVINTTISVNNIPISISNNFVSGDVLIVDSWDFRVLSSDTPLNFTGLFPLLSRGTNIIRINFDGTVDANITVVYHNTYS